MRAVDSRFRAMGTDVHLVVVGHDEAAELVELARERLADLERRWSRFLDDSEVAGLNAEPDRDRVVPVTAVTADLVALAVAHWRATGGTFDPTVLRALEAAGYDRSFDEGLGPATAAPAERAAPGTAPGCSGIVVDADAGTVRLPAGVTIDLGGIGKGRAADVVIDELVDAGAAGVLVNLGGDLRVAGIAPDGEPGWGVAIEDPADPARTLGTFGLVDGALATSTTAKRRWATGRGGEAHHLIDPRTGVSATTGIVAVTVIAPTAVEAEVAAKVALIDGRPPSQLPALLVRDDASTAEVNGIGAYRWSAAGPDGGAP